MEEQDAKAEKLEGIVRHDITNNAYVLIVDGKVVSKSKHPDYWEYHQRRGDLPKAIINLNVIRFIQVACGCAVKVFNEVSDCLTCKIYHKPDQEIREFKPLKTYLPSLLSILGFGEPQVQEQPEKRKRGRPKKLPQTVSAEAVPGMKENHLSDDEPKKRSFTKLEIIKMKQEHQRMIDTGDSSKEALIELTKKYRIDYKHAYELVHK